MVRLLKIISRSSGGRVDNVGAVRMMFDDDTFRSNI